MRVVLKKHPGVSAVMLAGVLAGALASLWLAPESWALWRKLGAGATTGAFLAFTVVATRALGAFTASEADDRVEPRDRDGDR